MQSKKQKKAHLDKSQKTITGLFSAAAWPKPPRWSGTNGAAAANSMSDNFAQDLDNIFGHYHESVEHLHKLQRLTDEREKERSARNRRDSLDDFELHPHLEHSMETSADEFGSKYVEIFQMLMQRGSGCPARTSQKQLLTIIANSHLHKSRLVSVRAALALAQLNKMFPPTTLEVDDEGKPASLNVNAGAWEPQSIREIKVWSSMGERNRRGQPMPLDYWQILLQFTSWACELEAGEEPGKRVGGLLMLEQVVAAIRDDFCRRMELFVARKSVVKKLELPTGLLKSSFLGRLLETGEEIQNSHTVGCFIGNLVEAVGGTVRGEPPDDGTGRDRQLHNRHNLGHVALTLLQMMLEYYGVLEDSGCFQSRASGRIYRCNLRVDIDKQMMEAFKKRLSDSKERTAFLWALAPRDRIRFIGALVATMRAKRATDGRSYPQLCAVDQFYDALDTELNEYVDVDTLEVLQYVAADVNYAAQIKGINTREGLAMVTSQLVHAAVDVAAQQANPELTLKRLKTAFCETADSIMSKQALDPEAILELKLAEATVTHALDLA
mmetsp:Transcript_20197/g.56009  ORF Transcript_20197/g.56009 Transcript_20197/m.56009 type:complete len:552 (-) Transcript_20197:437-2092(-)